MSIRELDEMAKIIATEHEDGFRVQMDGTSHQLLDLTSVIIKDIAENMNQKPSAIAKTLLIAWQIREKSMSIEFIEDYESN